MTNQHVASHYVTGSTCLQSPPMGLFLYFIYLVGHGLTLYLYIPGPHGPRSLGSMVDFIFLD